MAVAASVDDYLYNYGDYLSWPDEERWELIHGIPYDMSPAPSRIHQKISGNLHFEIKKFLDGKKCEIYTAPFDVRLPEGDEPDEHILTVVQPDISIICDEKKLDDKGCKGAPDAVIEITSPATFKKDIKDKLLLYERFGVPQYWIVHPKDQIIMAYKLNEQKQYGREEIFSKEDKISLNLKDGSIEIDLEKVF